MNLIIPYKEERIYNQEGAFITPKGEIIYTHGEHEKYSYDYCRNYLTKEQKNIYNLWLDKYEFSRFNLHSDFMVLVLSFDKIETMRRVAITTTSNKPHIKYYNYYLMDWNIDELNPMIYNYETKRFEYKDNSDWYEDKKVEEEIENIKTKVLKEDRHLFFK